MNEKKPKSIILIVEDDQLLLNIYVTVFEKEGFEVLTAQTGEDGYKIIIEQKPEVVLLDILLPGEMNGIDVLRKVKESKNVNQIPIVIMSNLADDKTISEGLILGANGYFIKSQTEPDDIVRNVFTFLK